MGIRTKFFIISDTQAGDFHINKNICADVVIHCGNLTRESRLAEYQKTLQMLQEANAPLKLVIAGNHDFALNAEAFKAAISKAHPALDQDFVKRKYGEYGEARQLIDQTPGITFLDKGTHRFVLDNGTLLTVYADPYTSAKDDAGQDSPGTDHDFDIGDEVDVVITHGPPHGVQDRSGSQNVGCPALFAAIARARPLLHCFGHIRESWGAALVGWKSQVASEQPSHLTDIDNSKTKLIIKLPDIIRDERDTIDTKLIKLIATQRYNEKGYVSTRHCAFDETRLQAKEQTLFVNAAIQGSRGLPPPWLVQIELPANQLCPDKTPVFSKVNTRPTETME